jgi:3-oxoacyl-[acyl-carrier-protein] synthase III
VVVERHDPVRRSSRCGGRPTTIKSLATYVPPRVLTNSDLEKMVDTTDEWILQRTGIRERHIVDPGVATSDLGKEAALKAIEAAGLSPDDIGLIVVGTVTPDMLFPSTACLLQEKIGASRAWGFDLSAACSAFTYSLTAASQIVASGGTEHALVVGADVMSSIIDYKDRSTCVLFGDGAGACVVSAAADDGGGAILDFEHEFDGRGGPALCMPAGGSRRPPSHETIDERLHYVKQDGQTVFRFAVRKTEEISRRILDRNGLTPNDLSLFVSHQANRRIIQSATERLGVPSDKDQYRALRQYDRRNDSARTQRRDVQRALEKRGSGAAGVGRRGLHGRRRARALGNLGN